MSNKKMAETFAPYLLEISMEQDPTKWRAEVWKALKYCLESKDEDLIREAHAFERYAANVLNGAKGKEPSEWGGIRYAIAICARSTEIENNQAAWLFVYEGLGDYIHKTLNHYGVMRNDCNREDYEQEIFLTIANNLKYWVPEKGELTTFFNGRINKTCVAEHNKYSSLSSPYYEELMINIERAREYLTKYGVPNPSPKEIHTVVVDVFGKKCSLKSVRTTIEMKRDFVSMDAPCGEDEKGTLGDSIAAEVPVNRDYSDVLKKTLNNLGKETASIIEKELKFFEGQDKRKKLTDKELRQAYLPYVDDLTDVQMRRLRLRAEKDFALIFNTNRISAGLKPLKYREREIEPA